MAWTLYLVGGACRDSFMGKKSKDMDFAVECDSFEEMKAQILKEGGQIYLEKPEFFSIRAHLPKFGASDFTLCRKDGFYSDGRRPDSVERADIYDDLSRRDCTINSIAQNVLTGEIIDPHEGRKDIQNRVIRATGNPIERLNEDALRGYRYLRFSITKEFTIEQELYSALKYYDDLKLKSVKVERVREELFKMFSWDTQETINLIGVYPQWFKYAFDSGIWLCPTIRTN